MNKLNVYNQRATTLLLKIIIQIHRIILAYIFNDMIFLKYMVIFIFFKYKIIFEILWGFA
jgi:hypothetical protein